MATIRRFFVYVLIFAGLVFIVYLGWNWYTLSTNSSVVTSTGYSANGSSFSAEPTPIGLPTGPALISALSSQSPFVVGYRMTAQEPFSIEKNDYPILGGLTQEELSFMAVGTASAGINLQEMNANSFAITGSSIVVYLPPIRLYDAPVLDTQLSYVMDRDEGIFVFKADEQLETQLRQQAERTLLAAMEENGLYEQAKIGIQEWLKNWLLSLGFTDVSFVTQ